jgi:hypothetical protein
MIGGQARGVQCKLCGSKLVCCWKEGDAEVQAYVFAQSGLVRALVSLSLPSRSHAILVICV